MVAQERYFELTPTERFDDGMSEVSLLVPSWQIDVLERVAVSEGITVAQLLRRMIHRKTIQHATPEELPQS